MTKYARTTECNVCILGSAADKALSAGLQKMLAACYASTTLKMYPDIAYENYLRDARVIEYIKGIVRGGRNK